MLKKAYTLKNALKPFKTNKNCKNALEPLKTLQTS